MTQFDTGTSDTGTSDTGTFDPDLLDAVASAQHVVALTGAGMSAESGVPTFRDAQTGLWEQYSAEDLATEDAWLADRNLVWSWYQWRARLVRACEPNAGHRALGEWQTRLRDSGGRLEVVTQNVDDLHERGGAEVLSHLHGSLFEFRCDECSEPAEHDPGVAADGRAGSDEDLTEALASPPPACASCRTGRLRPGIVWFGEMLPVDAFDRAQDALAECDLALVIGTSGIVQPAAALPYVALGNGAPVIEVNPAETPFTDHATWHLDGTAATTLPQLISTDGAAPHRR